MSDHRQIKKSRRITPLQWAIMFLVVSVIALVLVLIFKTPVGQQTTQPNAVAPDAKVVAAQYHCNDFRYYAVITSGECHKGGRQLEILTFPNSKERDQVLDLVKQYRYHYVLKTPQAVIYYYMEPSPHV